MSAVTFHTRDLGEADLQGSERAHADWLIKQMALAIILPGSITSDTRLADFFVDPPDYLSDSKGDWERSVALWLRSGWASGGEPALLIDGVAEPFDELASNTAIVLGSRPLRLLAWMKGMSENHGYFVPDSHLKVVETIDEGLDDNILRAGMGWDRVRDLFMESVKAAKPSAIVMSFSVSETFPDRYELRPPQDPDESDEAYEDRCDLVYDIPYGEAWDRCMALLHAAKWPVPLHPDRDQGYLRGKTAFDFIAQLWG